MQGLFRVTGQPADQEEASPNAVENVMRGAHRGSLVARVDRIEVGKTSPAKPSALPDSRLPPQKSPAIHPPHANFAPWLIA